MALQADSKRDESSFASSQPQSYFTGVDISWHNDQVSDKLAFHSQPVTKVLGNLDTDANQGLLPDERSLRLTIHGLNTLPISQPTPLWRQLLEQFTNPLVVLLLMTTAITVVTGKWLDASLIFGIVVVMAITSVVVERRSARSLSHLKELQQPMATVVIDGRPSTVLSSSIVPGDVVVLHEGDLVPADVRIIRTSELVVNEAALTGESQPSRKETKPVDEQTSLGDQKNMAFAGTIVLEGSGTAVVVRTGCLTELGKIAQYLGSTTATPTPLQKELATVSKVLFVTTIISMFAVFCILFLRGEKLLMALLTTTALAVSFVPEGLTAVMTVTLALAVNEMVRKKVIIKRLLAAEGLGGITDIATDKTGTLTEGRMRVSSIFLGDQEFEPNSPKLKKHHGYQRLLNVIRFCNNNKGPTEEALVSFLELHGYSFEIEERHLEHRFTSDVKRMSVVHRHRGQFFVFSKGAPDVLIPLCTRVLGRPDKKFTTAERQKTLKQAEVLASKGFRVLALAERSLKAKPTSKNREAHEQELTFLGLVALSDPLRATVPETVAGLKAAGIVPIMITGDHPAIARYIAEKAGILTAGCSSLLTGSELDQLLPRAADPAVRNQILGTCVFARVRPDHKVQIIELWQKSGRRIAMAGDGLNDAAALKKADVGIAMENAVGLTREIADVLLTGPYDALLRGVAVGRAVKLRTQLYLHYLLSGNLSEVGLFFVAIGFGLPLPMTPIILLVINLCTDALPAMAMAIEPEDPTSIQRMSRRQSQILSPKVVRGIVIQGVLSTILLACLFAAFLPFGLAFARSVVFTAYVWKEVFRAFTARSFRRSLADYGVFTNSLMNLAVLSILGTWIVVAFVLPSVFGLEVLPIQVIIPIILLSLVLPIVEELTKWANRSAETQKQKH